MTHPALTRIAADAHRTRNLREAQEGVTNVRILHLNDERGYCKLCRVPWPCRTWEATETEWERTRRLLGGQASRRQTLALVEQFGAADAERVSALQRSIDAAKRGHNAVAALVGLNTSSAFVASLLGMDEDTVLWHLREADSEGLLSAASKGVAL